MENTDSVKYDYPYVQFNADNNGKKNNEKMINRQPTPPLKSSATSASMVNSGDITSTANKSMDNPLYVHSKPTVVSEKT